MDGKEFKFQLVHNVEVSEERQIQNLTGKSVTKKKRKKDQPTSDKLSNNPVWGPIRQKCLVPTIVSMSAILNKTVSSSSSLFEAGLISLKSFSDVVC